MVKRIAKIKKSGIRLSGIRFLKRIFYGVGRRFERRERLIMSRNDGTFEELTKICNDPKYKSVFVFYPFLIWNMPAFQRPQQIATALAKNKDVLYLYCTPNSELDKLTKNYKVIGENLILLNGYETISRIKVKNKIVQFYSTDIAISYKTIKKCLRRKEKVLYEYIDGINEDLLGEIPKRYLETYKKIMENEEIFVVASANKLLDDVKKYRSKNYDLICNGVTIEDFNPKNNKIPKELKTIKSKYKKIICYYGALASWFDYELVKKCAKKYPDYAFVLIGIDYDKTLEQSGIEEYKNIIYLGKVDYKELVRYTTNSDLLTIPFLINDITESTSPVKLFEYMASQKPILTTAMPECRKYKSVMIGEDHDDYIAKIDKAIKKVDDKKYLELELKEAKENTWESKAEKIIELVNKDER